MFRIEWPDDSSPLDGGDPFDSASSKQIEETGFNAIAGSMPNLDHSTSMKSGKSVARLISPISRRLFRGGSFLLSFRRTPLGRRRPTMLLQEQSGVENKKGFLEI